MAEYTQESIHELVEKQRAFFRTGKTRDIDWRLEQLMNLKDAMYRYEADFEGALTKDLGRSKTEGYFCDIGTVILEINETMRGLKRWARPTLKFSGLVCFPSMFTRVYHNPYGVSLIISPFNFPVLLSFGVLIAAIAGGNTAIIKASSKSSACTELMIKIAEEIYPEEYVKVLGGGHDIADMLLEERFDKIFYTGSPNIAKHVMEAAAKNLTPVALELGGETGNWAVVRKDADIADAARKIAFLKICNSGQVCININQVAVAREVASELISCLQSEIFRQVGSNPASNPEYPKLVSHSAYLKCAEEAEQYRDRIVFGGTGDELANKYSTTLIYPVDINEPIVQHELFCPLLPIVPFDDDKIDDLMDTIAEREHGLALYLFTKDMKWARKTVRTQQFGGGCINEVCVHMMVKGAPFGGTGHSGMGSYHGIWGFREFTHPCTVLRGSTRFNLSLREHPYSDDLSKWKLKTIKMFEK